METIQYETTEGERWDTVSFKMYGTVNEVQRIIEENPQVPIADRLPGGLILEIPVLEENNIEPDKEQLPPWKQ